MVLIVESISLGCSINVFVRTALARTISRSPALMLNRWGSRGVLTCLHCRVFGI